MAGPESRIKVILNRTLEATAWITSLLIIAMMLLITYDVLLRYVFRAPSRWINDFVTLYLMIYIAILPAAWVLLKGDHVAVDLLLSYMGTKQQYYMTLVTRILGLIYSIVLTWQGGIYALREFTYKTEFPISSWLPVWPAVSVIFVSGLLLCLAFIMQIGEQLRLRKSNTLHPG
jgi:C4-dicarboxylate transporter DctQ subunit